MTEIDAMSFNVQRLTKRCHKLLTHINQQARLPLPRNALNRYHHSLVCSVLQEVKKSVGTSTWGWFIGAPAGGSFLVLRSSVLPAPTPIDAG